MRQALASIPPGDSLRRSELACQRLARTPAFQQAETVMLYMPIRHELDVRPLSRLALEAGKVVLLPRVRRDRVHMDAAAVTSIDDGQLAAGAFGILEPLEAPAFPPAEIELVIVPALAFSRDGSRLGRGGGFYDRFLGAGAFEAVTCGVAYHEQLLDDLPREAHDRRVDAVVTDRESVEAHCVIPATAAEPLPPPRRSDKEI